MRIILILFFFGATIGNLFNSFHGFSGTIPITPTHINPLLDWSSYLLFGFAGVLIGLVTLFIDKYWRKNPPSATWGGAIGACGVLGIFYFLSACMFLSNYVILGLLIIGFVLAWRLYDPTVYALVASLIVAIGGTLVEITLVHNQVYYYSRPQFMGVAYWLPFLYGIATITTSQLVRVLRGNNSTI